MSEPMLAPLLRQRAAAAAFGIASTLQIGLTAASVALMECPFARALHIPCPACGLTRACVALLSGSGRWVELHALAPAVLVVIGLMLVAALLPAPARAGLADRVASLERRTAAPALALAAVLLYWVVRLIYAPATFGLLLAHH